VAVSDTLIGTLFDGRYQVLRKLGAGGMANVYLAEDQELGRRVAIKILNERHANDEQFVERFRREAKNAAALSHPNIVSIYDRGEAEGTYYIAMEYLDGRSLKELIVGHGPAPVKIAVEYARQILSALRFAHLKGIVHRDIKPHNVLVNSDGRVKVTDFGIARAGASQMTEAGSIVGTAQYLSPEQARGTTVDQRSDLYSLGIVLYELLTGTVPFSGDTPVEIAMKHLSQVPEPPSARRPDVPRDLDLIVMRALAKNPDDRYQSAEEMDADLERFVGDGPVAPETEEFATQIMRPPAEPYAPTAATMITPPRYAAQIPPLPPPIYYDVEQPIHRRPIWPWIAALLFVAGAGVGGWYIYHQISNKLSNSAPVAVRLYLDMQEPAARDAIKTDGFDPRVNHHASRTTAAGLVYRQVPIAGTRQAKGSPVTIWVSSGKPKVAVPPLKGMPSAEAEAALTKLHLKPDVHPVPGGAKAGIVTAQDPKAGTKLVEGAQVRINVAKGPTPVAVPSVVNDTIGVATAALNQLGFKVIPTFVNSSTAANTVLDQSPNAATTAAKGSSVSLTVSSGPKTVAVPEVTSLDYGSATQQLQNDGFRSTIVYETVSDPNSDGVVLDQSPAGGSLVKPNSRIVLTVGRYQSGGTTTATTTTATTTTATTTDTTTTDTTTTPTP
jgi:serine/threonine-protein kinase